MIVGAVVAGAVIGWGLAEVIRWAWRRNQRSQFERWRRKAGE